MMERIEEIKVDFNHLIVKYENGVYFFELEKLKDKYYFLTKNRGLKKRAETFGYKTINEFLLGLIEHPLFRLDNIMYGYFDLKCLTIEEYKKVS
jgi:hypothetical protein